MIAVRSARPEDAAAMSAVLIASITALCAADHDNDAARIAGWTANKTPEGVRVMLADPELTMLVAELDGTIAAVGAFAGNRVALNYVAPWARFAGVSKALLAGLEQGLALGGIRDAALTSTHTARAFYRSQGWLEDDSPVPCETGSGFAMTKRL